MRSCHDVPNGSTVFLRTGMDVPLAHGRITDPSRIEETRPTIDLLLSKGCRILLTTHIGRPQGADPALSARPVAEYLAQSYQVRFAPSLGAGQLAAYFAELPGMIVVAENLRYDPREEANDDAFAKELVQDCDVVVQDAYANCHREHASMVGVLRYKPGYAGLLVEKELQMMARMGHPEHPYVAIIGGAKADKLGTIKGLLDKVDAVLVGGVLANTFLKAAGFPVGASKTDDAKLAEALALYATGKVILPIDAVLADSFSKDAHATISPIGAVKQGLILDIGPDTVQRYTLQLMHAKTIVWGGPIGVFEWPAFAEGTKAIAKAVAEATDGGAYSLAAGGDSGAALVTLGYKERVSHVSTGGGVTLQLLEGKPLPVILALEENAKRTF